MDWKPKRKKSQWRRRKPPKNAKLRKKYGPQWWKADPTIKRGDE